MRNPIIARAWSRIDDLLDATQVGYFTSYLKLKRVQYSRYFFVNESDVLLEDLSKTYFPLIQMTLKSSSKRNLQLLLLLSFGRFFPKV